MSHTEVLVSTDPATGEIVGEVPLTPPESVPSIVSGTRTAQKQWAQESLEERRRVLEPCGQIFMDETQNVAEIVTREMGKPLREAVAEVQRLGPPFSQRLQEIQESLSPETLADAVTCSTLYRDPFGVCAVITPWNFPVAMPHSLIIPALMAGNSVVFKPSEESPLVGRAYVDILNRTLPPGLLEIIYGADSQGRALVGSAVDLIAFTGSREVGKRILADAAPRLKRVVLELGGKDPLIVLAGADLPRAAAFAANNSFRNAGQVCVSTERIYVDKKVAPEFERLLVGEAKRFVTGNGMDEATEVGPMIHERQREHVLQQMRRAISQGAQLLAGSTSPPERFITPSVLTGLDHTMDIMQEETFGPVACVMSFETKEQAIEWANGTPFGLGATVFGETEEAQEVARRLTSGMIGVNQSCGGASGSPWVGAKESGYGFHSSKHGHRQFAQTRVVSTPLEG